MEDKCQCTNNTQETGKPDICSTNTTGIPNVNNENKSMVIDNIYKKNRYCNKQNINKYIAINKL